jgi:hypothetical protein
MPVAAALVASAPLGLFNRKLLAPAAAAVSYVAALFWLDFHAARFGRRRSERTVAFRTQVAAYRILRPLAFRWGHATGGRWLRRTPPDPRPRPADLTVAEEPSHAAQPA